MNIGINLLAFVPGVSGGIEFYIRNLLASLAEIDDQNQYYLFTTADNDKIFALRRNNFHRIRIPIRSHPQIRRVAYEQIYLPMAAKRLSLAVLHSPSYTWPLFAGSAGVVTICDMLYKVHPECVTHPKLMFWRLFVPWSVRRCKKVLTISEASKKDIVRYLGVSEKKVVVTRLALDRQFQVEGRREAMQIDEVLDRYRIRRPYVLSVGSLGKHKNPVAVVRAVKELHGRKLTASLNLVLAGRDYGSRGAIQTAVSTLGLSDCVVLPGYVVREDLPSVYSGAAVYVSTSHFEGFGLTLLEAMAQGVPVVASNQEALAEVAGNAATIIDPDDYRQIAEAIYRLLADSDYRREMVQRGHDRVSIFRWEDTAKITLEAYRDALG